MLRTWGVSTQWIFKIQILYLTQNWSWKAPLVMGYFFVLKESILMIPPLASISTAIELVVISFIFFPIIFYEMFHLTSHSSKGLYPQRCRLQTALHKFHHTIFYKWKISAVLNLWPTKAHVNTPNRRLKKWEVRKTFSLLFPVLKNARLIFKLCCLCLWTLKIAVALIYQNCKYNNCLLVGF